MDSRNEQLKAHFSTHYSSSGVFGESIQKCALTCKHATQCNFLEETEASFTGAMGDPASTVMVVAESPSGGWGKGAHFSGHSSNLAAVEEGQKVSELMKLLTYLRDLYGAYPYFTDWIKCGVAKTNDKALLNIRKYHCVETHLREEIRILNPTKIVCLGNDCFADVSRLAHQMFPEKANSDFVIKLTHFSRRASLPLTIKDKMDIIWKLELGLISDEEAARELVLQLSHLKKKLPKRK